MTLNDYYIRKISPICPKCGVRFVHIMKYICAPCSGKSAAVYLRKWRRKKKERERLAQLEVN